MAFICISGYQNRTRIINIKRSKVKNYKISQLKHEVRLATGVPEENQSLKLCSKELQTRINDKSMTFEDYGIYDGATIFLEFKCIDIIKNNCQKKRQSSKNTLRGETPGQNVLTYPASCTTLCQSLNRNTNILSSIPSSGFNAFPFFPVKTLTQFHQVINNNSKVAVYFTRACCWTCKMINSKLDQFARTYTNIKFIKVDVEESTEIARECDVKGLHTFKLFMSSTAMSLTLGASLYELNEELRQINTTRIYSPPLPTYSLSTIKSTLSECSNPCYIRPTSQSNELNMNESERIDSTQVYENSTTHSSTIHHFKHTNSDPKRKTQVPKLIVPTTQVVSNTGSQMGCKREIIRSNITPSGIRPTKTKVDVVPTLSQFEEILKNNAKVAVNFTSSWRRHYEGANIKFTDAVDTYPKIKFITVNIDENRQTAVEYHVYSCMFKFYKNGREFSQVSCIDTSQACWLIKKLNLLNNSTITPTPEINDPMSTFANHEAGLNLPTKSPSSLCTTSTYSDPFETNSKQIFSHEPLDNVTIPQHYDHNNDTNSSLHHQYLVSLTPGLVEPTEHLKPNHISVRSHNISRQYFSKPSPIDPMYTDATPSSSRFMRPNYNTFSQDSQNPKVDQVNNLCDYVPGKIISTHFYEQPTRKHNRCYNTSNDSSYAHANNGASRHTSTHTQTQQPRNNVHVNTSTQPNTVPHAMNSAPYNPTNIPINQGAHTSSYPTRRRSCCWCFCCICLLIMLIVVLLISIVVIGVFITFMSGYVH